MAGTQFQGETLRMFQKRQKFVRLILWSNRYYTIFFFVQILRQSSRTPSGPVQWTTLLCHFMHCLAMLLGIFSLFLLLPGVPSHLLWAPLYAIQKLPILVTTPPTPLDILDCVTWVMLHDPGPMAHMTMWFWPWLDCAHWSSRGDVTPGKRRKNRKFTK